MKDTSGAIGECAIPIHIDKTAPVITGLTYNNKTLTGTATDDGSGIKYYLFSKTANLTNISSSGTVVNPTSTSITKTFSPTDTTATYYFYVQDQVGKIASRPITFTRITLEDHGDPSNESLDTDYVYTTKDVGVYLDQNHTTQMTTGANPIVIPQVAGYRFTGYYSAAVTCASLSGFLFAAIIDSMRPKIFEDKKETEVKFERSLKDAGKEDFVPIDFDEED